LKSLRRGGTLAVVGMPGDPVPVSMVSLVAGEIRIVASAVSTRKDLRELLDIAAAGQVRCRIEERPLDQINQILVDLRRGAIPARIVISELSA